MEHQRYLTYLIQNEVEPISTRSEMKRNIERTYYHKLFGHGSPVQTKQNSYNFSVDWLFFKLRIYVIIDIRRPFKNYFKEAEIEALNKENKRKSKLEKIYEDF